MATSAATTRVNAEIMSATPSLVVPVDTADPVEEADVPLLVLVACVPELWVPVPPVLVAPAETVPELVGTPVVGRTPIWVPL